MSDFNPKSNLGKDISGFYSARFYTDATKVAKFPITLSTSSGDNNDGVIGRLFEYWATQCTNAGGVVELNQQPNVASIGVPQGVRINSDNTPFTTFLQNNASTGNQTKLIFPKPNSGVAEGWDVRVGFDYIFGNGTSNSFILDLTIPSGNGFPTFTFFDKIVSKPAGSVGSIRIPLRENTSTRVSPLGSLLQNGFDLGISVFDGDVTFGNPELDMDDLNFLITK